MVNGRRRRPHQYPLNIRHHGYSVSDLIRATRYRAMAAFFLLQYNEDPSEYLNNLIVICLRGVMVVTGNRVAINPAFNRADRFLENYTDHQLYHLRIRNRAYVPRLMAALHIPRIITCENGTIIVGEEAFLMLLYWFSFPRLLSTAQEEFGLEYSQISRIVRTMIYTIMIEWQHLIDDNLEFFAPRFPAYCTAISNKYLALYQAVDPKYALTALLTDGTQRQHCRDRRTNFSGHKRMYCFGYLVTTAPDGMIADISGAFAGRKNDHIKQNESHLSQRLVACQDGNAIQYNTSTDKGKINYMYFISTLFV